MDTRLIFGRRLKEARNDSGITLKELANKVKLSESTVSRYEKGIIEAKHPTVILLAKTLGVNPVWLLGYPGAEKYLPKIADANVIQIPILGCIEAGRTIVVQKNIVGYEYAPASAEVDFCLVIKGDSMINARMFDGDVVCIRQQSKVENGEVAVVIIEGKEATLRRGYRVGDNLILRSENPKYPDQIFGASEKDKVEIIGKAVYLRTEVR